MGNKDRSFGLTGNQLKILALIAMTFDHIGYHLLPQYLVLRIVGRLAMPIFAWMIAEGCEYTKNRARYFLTMLAFGLVSQVVMWFAAESLMQCIFITFSMSILLISVLDLANRKRGFFTLCLLGITMGAICYICVFLPKDIPHLGFSVDYGIYGVLLPVAIYLGRTKPEKLMLAAVVLIPTAIRYGSVQWYALLSLPLLALYNGKRGKARMKYLFYIYYPLHTAVIYGIAYIMSLKR